MKRVLLTGAGGLLGRAVTSLASRRDGLELLALTRAELDITDTAAVAARLDAWRPAVVLNAAAYTNVDGAETEPVAAIAANAVGPAVLAAETSRRDQVLIHISTDHVFDGDATAPYAVTDATGPRSVYGRSKEQGEQWVRQLQPRHCVVRTAGLFGAGGRNFVDAIRGRANAGQPLRVVADQVCCRTYAADLAGALVELLEAGITFGTYHATNAGHTSWYGFAQDIVKRIGAGVEVTPVTSVEYGAAAWRPAFSALDGSSWAAAGLTPLRAVEDALAEYLAESGRAGGSPVAQRGVGR